MKKTVYILCVLIAAAYSNILHAEGSDETNYRRITGVVLDENNLPIPGASVIVVGTTIGAGTNTKGEFSLNIKSGSYNLRASFLGYTPKVIPISSENRITFVLTPSENKLDEVVVTGTRTEKSLKDVPVLTRVISQEDIKRINPINLKTVLEYEMPGLQFGRHHGSGLTNLTFQGSSGEYVLFLVDGERISGEGAADNIDFEQFNIDNIERIEVIKGAASTLYGSNALGGVVNVITKKANRPVVGNVSGRYSSRHEQKYDASGGMKKDRFSFLSGLSYRQKDGFTVTDKNGSGSVDIRGYEIWQTSHRFGYAFTDKFSADLKGTFYHNRQPATSEEGSQNLYRDYAVNAKLHYLMSVNHRLDFSYNIDNYIKYTEYPGTAQAKEKTYHNLKNTYRLDYNWFMSDQSTLSAGAEVNTERLKHYMFKDTTAYRVETYTIYAQEDWRINEKFNVVAGIRADYHSEYNLHVTPKLSLMYRLSDFTFRGGYAAGYRSPSLKELYEEWYHEGGGGFYIYGNPDLKPESSHHFSLSAEYTKGIFNGAVSGYFNRFSDKIVNVVNGTGGSSSNQQFVNAEKSRTTGLDASGQLRFKWGLMVKGSYAYVNNHDQVNGKNQSTVRPHTAVVGINYNHTFGKVGTYMGLNGRWMSSVKAWRETQGVDVNTGSIIDIMAYTKYDSRTICALNAGAQFPRGIAVSVGLENLLNFKDKQVSTDTSISPEQGISFTMGVSINLADMFKW